jgi:hypothetical protein
VSSILCSTEKRSGPHLAYLSIQTISGRLRNLMSKASLLVDMYRQLRNLKRSSFTNLWDLSQSSNLLQYYARILGRCKAALAIAFS